MKDRCSYGWLGLPAVCAMILLFGLPAGARRIKTRHAIPKSSAQSAAKEVSDLQRCVSLASDSILFCENILPSIRFYGFDKTAGSSVESFFISNGLQETLVGLEVEITYTDMKGRQLHKRNVKIDCNIPAGETKRADIKSWDTQKSFYFHQSTKPKRQSTPFDVKLRLLSLTLPPSR